MNYIEFLSCNTTLGNCCSDPGLVLILDSIRKIMNLIQIIVPILLIIMATVAFIKLVIDPNQKNGLKKVKNMLNAAVVVFFIPVIVNTFFNMLPNSFDLTSCWQKAKSLAESSREISFEYISPYEEEEKTNIMDEPSNYEKGKPKEDNKNNPGGSISSKDAKGILAGAEKVHTMYEQNRWAYYQNLGQLKWNDIKYSTNNPSRMTCCATFVGSAFYVGGVFTESEINKYNYNSQHGISELCKDHGWNKISSYSQLAAGDIVIMSGPGGGSTPEHVQIYAGNGTWYNAGSTDAIQRENPYSSDGSARFLWAWRKPA